MTDLERITYLWPSRYGPSDRMLGLASRQFGTRPLVEAIIEWGAAQLEYVPGSTGPVNDAVDTMLAGRGVCRDFAHLGIALCRASYVPARMAAVYAPGLSPMDFHAVFEASVDERWYVFDATRRAPRPSLVRIATGRDAADTAFVTVLDGRADLETTEVTATVDGDLPVDDSQDLVPIS